MKKRIVSNIVGLCLIIVMVALSPSIIGKIPAEREVEIKITQTWDEKHIIPAEATLEPILERYLNSQDSSEEPNVIVEYDVQTGREHKYTVNYEEIRSPIIQLEPYEGDYSRKLQERISEEDVFSELLGSSSASGSEELTRVYNTTQFPFSAVVKIIAKYNETHNAHGSGVMIDSNHVLTAGHVVYDWESGWRENVRVIPGMNGSGSTLTEEPYGRAYATHMRSTSGYTQDLSIIHDWAVITLDRDIGDETGWLGVINLPYTHNNYSDRVYTAGYPATTLSGLYMYNVSGVGGSATEYEHIYSFYSEGGQSGSGVWTYQNSSPYILSILAYGPGGGGGIGTGTRITTEKFDLLNLWLEQDASEEPHVDFSVTGSNNIIVDLDGINIVYILLTGIPITTSVQNYGNIDIDKVILGYYLSVDENITSDDYQIGKTTIRNLAASESRSIENKVRIPLKVPPGSYEIGWIIDPNNEIEELFEDNNAFLNGVRLYVRSTFLDQMLTSPLWLSLLIGGVALVIIVPTLIIVIKRMKRKKL